MHSGANAKRTIEAPPTWCLVRRDGDDDGWPDFWDVSPTVTGYKNGRN